MRKLITVALFILCACLSGCHSSNFVDNNMIVKHVHVNRNLEPAQMVAATGFETYGHPYAASSMIRGTGEDVNVYFFRVPISSCISYRKLDQEYERRGLIPADPYSLIQCVVDNRDLIAGHALGTYWKGDHGRRYSVAFCAGGRCIHVEPSYKRWWSFAGNGTWWSVIGAETDCWWFAGIRR